MLCLLIGMQNRGLLMQKGMLIKKASPCAVAALNLCICPLDDTAVKSVTLEDLFAISFQFCKTVIILYPQKSVTTMEG